MLCRFRCRRRTPTGQAAMEFVLGAVVFLLVAFAAMQFGLIYHYNLTLDHACREGVRYAAVNALSKSDAQIASWVQARLSGLPAPTPTVTVSAPTRQSGEPITVSISYDFRPSVPLIAHLLPNPARLTASTTMHIE